MAAKKKTDTDPNNPGAPAGRVIVQPKNAMQWATLLQTASKEKWRELRVSIRVRDKLLAGKPRDLDAAQAMLKARGLEDQIEAFPEDPTARAAAAEQVKEQGVCEFHRRPGKTGIWFPTNNIKAGLKENWSVLGYRKEYAGTRVSLAEAVFVYSDVGPDVEPAERDYIRLGEKPDGVVTSVCHSDVRGERFTSIKRNEYLERPTLTFMIRVASEVAGKFPDDAIAKMLLHYAEHGLGAARSQGNGKFDILSIEDVGIASDAA